MEYSGGDTTQWPAGDTREQSSRWQGGMRLALSKPLSVSLGWERGDTLSAGVQYRFDLSQPSASTSTVPPLPSGSLGWDDTARALAHHGQIQVHEVYRSGDSLQLNATYTGQEKGTSSA
ncbi:hypothetical protein HLB35_01380 [Halomonas sp. TBZ9]|uniref:Uncharacterized protein n=1 Tax=Vreelandella azerica TaxID=2732867 RepID=A0A7Y3TV16_9GAMM|nr:YjbH domain-containing protein [Halomonas azerica]NOG30756.1 hypothetical protein [Halomonas azerica]